MLLQGNGWIWLYFIHQHFDAIIQKDLILAVQDLGCHSAMNSCSSADDPSAHHKEIHLHYKVTASLRVYGNSSKLVMYCHCANGQAPTQAVIRENIYRPKGFLKFIYLMKITFCSRTLYYSHRDCRLWSYNFPA